MAAIFISYSRKNQAVANDIANQLRSMQHDVWMDTSSITAGQQWDESIAKGIKSQTAFITLLSPDSVRSNEVRNELNMAISEQKTIIPIIVSKVILDNEWKYKLSRFQILNYEAGPEKCMTEIQKALDLLDQTLFLPGDELIDTLMNEHIRIFTFWIKRLIHSSWNGDNWVTFTATADQDAPEITLQRNRDGSVTFKTCSSLLRENGTTTEQQQLLALMKWQADTSDYTQVMNINDEAGLNKAANLVMLTFMQVYGVDPNESVKINHA